QIIVAVYIQKISGNIKTKLVERNIGYQVLDTPHIFCYGCMDLCDVHGIEQLQSITTAGSKIETMNPPFSIYNQKISFEQGLIFASWRDLDTVDHSFIFKKISFVLEFVIMKSIV